MTLRYISLLLENDVDGIMYSSEFQYHTRFISNYFSREIRKHKFDTDNIFNMICITLLSKSVSKPSKITAIDVLETYLPFDKKRYEKIKGTKDNSYYLELLEQGFKKSSEFKSIPLDILLNLIDQFQKGGCKNEWLHKKKRFKENDIEVILSCEFTTNYFQLVVTINQITTKKKLVKGVAIKTKPDEIHFQKMFKNILIQKNFIIITDASDSDRVLINIKEAKKGIFEKSFSPYIYSDDYTKEENKQFEKSRNEVIKILSYDGSGF